jgi:hypothetical protein
MLVLKILSDLLLSVQSLKRLDLWQNPSLIIRATTQIEELNLFGNQFYRGEGANRKCENNIKEIKVFGSNGNESHSRKNAARGSYGSGRWS